MRLLNQIIISLLILFAVLPLLALYSCVHAQPVQRFGNIGYCQMTALTTAKTVATANCTTGSVPAAVTAAAEVVAEICVSGAAIRYTSNAAITPTAAIGIPVSTNTCFQYSGPIVNLQIIQQAATATVDIEFFQ
jgi:hypothetical protein